VVLNLEAGWKFINCEYWYCVGRLVGSTITVNIGIVLGDWMEVNNL